MPTRTRTRSAAKPTATSAWDFSKEEGGGGKRYREDDYLVTVIKVKAVISEEKKTPGLEVTFKFKDGKHKGETFTDRLWNTPKSLWRMRSLIEAVGEEVPDSAADWKAIARLVLKREVIVTLGDDEYEGRVRSRVTDFLDPDEFDDDDADEDDEDDDLDDEDEDDTDEEEGDEYDEMERPDLRKVAKKMGLTVKRAWSDDELRDAIREAEGEDDEDDDLDDEDEGDEPEPPKRRSRSTAKPAARKRKPKADDDDDLDGLDLDDI